MRIALLLFTILVNSFSGLLAQDYKAILNGTLLDTKDKKIIEKSAILIKDNKIIEVGLANKLKIPIGAQIIDASGKFIMPGMIDGHIHFFQSGGLYTRPDAIDLRDRLPYLAELNWILSNIEDLFRRYTACGVTTVVDLGGPFWNFDIRDLSKKIDFAPNVFTCGPLIASYQPEALTTDDPPIIKVKTIDEALALVRRQVEKKADYIKIWYVVGRKDAALVDDFFPIAKAIADEAHKHNLPCYIHALELETAKKAIMAGADVLAHTVKDKVVDDEFIKLCKKNSVSYIPTLWVLNSYNAVFTKQLELIKQEHLLANTLQSMSLFDMYNLSEDELGDRQKKLLAEMKPIVPDSCAMINTKIMQDAGINVVVGTDAGNIGVLHGPAIYHDFLLMCKAGISNFDILKDATWNAAKMLRKEKELGLLAKDYLADIVILNSNPLTDILNTSDINLVIKGGKIFSPDTLIKYEAYDIATIQLNAYNSRNLEAFLECYSQDIEVYSFPDSLQYKGLDKMRAVYDNFFKNNKLVHCQLINRVHSGKYIIDHEKITGSKSGEFEAVAMYEIIGKKITKIWFLPKVKNENK